MGNLFYRLIITNFAENKPSGARIGNSMLSKLNLSF